MISQVMEVALTWTDENKKQVAELWCAGKTASEIAQEFEGKTRNSIIGLIHRMKLPKREVQPVIKKEKVKIERAQQKTKAAFFVTRKQSEKHRMPPISVAPPPSVTTGDGLTLSQLRDHHCHDVIGYLDGNLSKAVYCGAERHKNTSYCEYHSSIYHVPPSRRS